ncbi:MAG TPA: hypothetical protein VFC95_02595 [Guyparkeria sp.]|nr:hypothetical protein [Guyparkeria sp.]
MRNDLVEKPLFDPVDREAVGRPQEPLGLAGLLGLQRKYPHGQLIVRQLLGEAIDALLPHWEMLHGDGRSPVVPKTAELGSFAQMDNVSAGRVSLGRMITSAPLIDILSTR